MFLPLTIASLILAIQEPLQKLCASQSDLTVLKSLLLYSSIKDPFRLHSLCTSLVLILHNQEMKALWSYIVPIPQRPKLLHSIRAILACLPSFSKSVLGITLVASVSCRHWYAATSGTFCWFLFWHLYFRNPENTVSKTVLSILYL